MVRGTVKTISYSTGSRKVARSRQLVNRAANLLRKRMATSTRAPLRTGGWYGGYGRRGREELKTIDTESYVTSTSSGVLYLLSGVAQGTDYTQRIGRKINMKSLLMRVSMNPNSGTTSNVGDFVRMLIIYDAQANGTAPAVTDVLQTANYLSPMNLNNRDRFKIISEKLVSMNPAVFTSGSLTNGNAQNKSYEIYKKIYLDEVFSNTTALIGSIASGSIYLLIIAAAATATGVGWNCRIRFSDS